MKIKTVKSRKILKSQKGVSVPEVIIVLLIIAIVAVLALPQMISSRRLFRFSGMQREVVTLLREARQEAMSQRTPITFSYTDGQKEARLYGGNFGAEGTAKNLVYSFDNSGLSRNDIVYGRPSFAPITALPDGTDLTPLTSGKLKIPFQSDGTVLDGSGNPQDFALFFFHDQHKKGTAFAISVLGAGGRVKLWRYSEGVNAYVE